MSTKSDADQGPAESLGSTEIAAGEGVPLTVVAAAENAASSELPPPLPESAETDVATVAETAAESSAVVVVNSESSEVTLATTADGAVVTSSPEEGAAGGTTVVDTAAVLPEASTGAAGIIPPEERWSDRHPLFDLIWTVRRILPKQEQEEVYSRDKILGHRLSEAKGLPDKIIARKKVLDQMQERLLVDTRTHLRDQQKITTDLQAKNSNLERDIANLKKVRPALASQRIVTGAALPSARPEVTADVRRKGAWLSSIPGWLKSTAIAGLILVILLLVLSPLYRAVRDWSYRAESASLQSSEAAVEISRKRSTPTKAELDNNPAIQRTKELIQRMQKINEKSFKAKKGE